jgi:ribosomal protein S27AE
MQSSGKLIGLILIASGLACGAIGGLWAAAQRAGEKLDAGAMIFAIGALAVIALPLIGAGIFFFVRGGREEEELKDIAKQRKILNMVSTQGQVRIAEVALELGATKDQLKQWLYDLVGKGLFSGYINWDDGVLYSKQASQLKSGTCPNCGAKLEMAGKGVVKCGACGSEVFLSS